MSSSVDAVEFPSFVYELETVLLLHDQETGKIVDANQAAEAAYGYSVERLRESDVGLLSADEPEYSTEAAIEAIQAASEGQPQGFNWKIKRATGELRWVDVFLNPITLNETEYVLAEVTDITEYKRQTERVELLHRILRHNLRNDMNVVRGYADQLGGNLDGEESELAETITAYSNNLISMAELVTELSDLASTDPADFHPVQVNHIIDDIVTDFQATHPEAHLSVDAEMPVELSSDGSLRLAIEQAVENAIIHHDDTPRVVIRTAREDAGSRVVIQVLDDGPPISANELAVIDSQMERSPTNHGTGAGMFLMWWCAESLGGKLEINPGDDRGNVVTFTLPVVAD